MAADSPTAVREVRIGLWSSGWLHVLVFVCLLVEAAWWWWQPIRLAADPTASQVVLNSRVAELAPLPETNTVIGEIDVPDITAGPVAASVSLPPEVTAAQDSLTGSTRTVDPDADRDPKVVFKERIEDRIAAATADAEQLSEEEQRRRLEQLAGRLENVTSTESLDALATTVQGLLGTRPRAQQPAAEPVAGEFDYASAQPHEVKKETLPDGQVRYKVVLVDAEGRQFTTIMSEAEGESLYKTMQLLKSNPLAEAIYRRLVMSMLDELLRPSQPPQPTDPAGATK